MTRGWKPVKDFDPNSQDADEKYDPARRLQTKDGVYYTGKGQQGGSSQKTPQAQRMVTGNSRGGSYVIGSSSPKDKQRIRG